MDFIITHPNLGGRTYHVTGAEDLDEAVEAVVEREPRRYASEQSLRQYATDVSDEEVLDAMQDRLEHGVRLIHVDLAE